MTQPQPGCVCVNGRFSLPHEATVSALDAGFQLGDGLFESLRASGAVAYLLQRHLDRLAAAAATLGFDRMPDGAELDETVRETLRRSELDEAYVRITVTRGAGGRGLAAPDGPPTVVVAVLALASPARPVAPVAAVTLARPTPGAVSPIKSTSWQHAVLARRDAAQRGGDEGIYVGDSGRVLEGVTSNVFVVAQGELLTPPLTDCLAGITRGRVLELAAASGVRTRETTLDVAALARADEVFVTNAVQGLRLLDSLDGSRLRRHATAGGFAALSDLYERDRRPAAVGSA